MSNNPYEVPPGGFSPGGMGGGSGPGSQAVIAKVTPPAIGLIVVGIINILLSLWGALSSALFLAGVNPMAAAQQQQMDEIARQGGEGAEFAQTMMQFTQVAQGPLGLVMNLLALVVGGVIVAGALKMKSLQAYGFALTAAILAMIPCLSNCCIVGLPIGIWALVILMDNNVKQSFR